MTLHQFAVVPFLLFSAAAFSQTATVTFTFDNPALVPPHYSITMHEDGSAQYSQPATEGTASLTRPMTVNDQIRKQVFAVARKNHFTKPCDMKQKTAFTGTKTLSYAGSDGSGSCTFNYSGNSQIEAVASQLIAVANTLDEGRKLESLLSHDKLGLDAEMEVLTGEQADGRALDLENIAPVLHAISSDEEVLNRPRMRAEALLKGQTGH